MRGDQRVVAVVVDDLDANVITLVVEDPDLDHVARRDGRGRALQIHVLQSRDRRDGRGIVGYRLLGDHGEGADDRKGEQQLPGLHAFLREHGYRGLLAPRDPNYDGFAPVFLHQIHRLLAGALLAAMLLCGCVRRDAPPAPPKTLLAQVVAGSGNPGANAIEAVRQMVAEQEPALVARFGNTPRHPYFVFVHADRAQLPDSLAANLHEDSPGFALLGTHQVHLVWDEMRRTGSNLRGVVVHELVHELLDQFVAPHGALIPRWFHEGLAQTIAGDTYLGAREDEIVWRIPTGRLLAFGELRQRFPSDTEALRLAYAQSYSYVAWLVNRYGFDGVLAVAAATDGLTSFERALAGHAGVSTLDLETDWKDHVVTGSGAPWRVALDQCFSLLLVAALPVLVLALMRRLAVDRRAAERLAQSELEPPPPPPPMDPVEPIAAAEPPDELPNDERRPESSG